MNARREVQYTYITISYGYIIVNKLAIISINTFLKYRNQIKYY